MDVSTEKLAHVQTLRAGDVLLYSSTGIVGRLIRRKTWADDLWGGANGPSHCEVYLGNGESFAARDFVGTDIFPLRVKDLIGVLSPVEGIDAERLRAAAGAAVGKPYDYGALVSFFTLGPSAADRNDAEICSEAIVNVLRRAGYEPFTSEVAAAAIAPAHFLITPRFELRRVPG